MPKMTDSTQDRDCSENVYLARLNAMSAIVAAHLSITKVETSQISEIMRDVYDSICAMPPANHMEEFEYEDLYTQAQHLDVETRTSLPDTALVRITRKLASHVGTRQAPSAPRDPILIPAVPINESVHPDYIICLEDGKRLKTLEQHLSTTFGMSVDAYRHRWGLPSDYPMVAPNYSSKRKSVARRTSSNRANRQEETHQLEDLTSKRLTGVLTKPNKNVKRRTANLLDKMASRRI